MSNRVNFGKLPEVLEAPDLISVQLQSWSEFIQADVAPEARENVGLQASFKEVFPIESFDKNCKLDFVSYETGEPKKNMYDCLKDGETYSVPLHVTFRLENKSAEGSAEILEDRVFMGDLPFMSNRATFVVNGAERVIISQLHRTPGICFEKDVSTKGRDLYTYRIIPDRGSWMEVQYDNNDLMYIYLDRKRRRRKFLISTFLRALAYETDRELLDIIYGVQSATVASLAKDENITDKVIIEDVVNSDEEIVAKALEPLNPDIISKLKALKIKKVEFVDVSELGNTFILSLQKDPSVDKEDALKTIYKKMRPGDPASINNAKQLIKRLFFDLKHYDLGLVGRYKINQKLKLDVDPESRILEVDDLVAATKYVMRLRNDNGRVDDIDHLGSRRVRTVGELVQNQVRVGLARTERLIRERMTLFDMESETMTPTKLVNPKALQSVIRDFFGRSQLSQFMDQTNPLAELTAKRRLSALGPGGLSRERAGFEVRDVHSSHYGRICPIETPEGPNIGLISSLAIFARVNPYGFIETPYRKVVDGKVTEDIEYVTADQEEDFTIAQANAELENNKFVNNYVLSRNQGDSLEAVKDGISHMDVSPKQLVSPATSCIPFLEHDDANRALMGSNMQRQAVPLMISEAPH